MTQYAVRCHRCKGLVRGTDLTHMAYAMKMSGGKVRPVCLQCLADNRHNHMPDECPWENEECVPGDHPCEDCIGDQMDAAERLMEDR